MKKQLLTILGVAALGLSGQAQYCVSGATYIYDSRCDNVGFTGIVQSINNNTSSEPCGPGYNDYTAQQADVFPGMTYPMTVGIGTCGSNYSRYSKVYIDWNQDLDFDDPGEEVAASALFGTSGSWNFNVNVPLTAAIGTTRMRVVVNETWDISQVFPCGNFSWGETEDYTIHVVSPEFTVVTPDTLELACNGDSTATIVAQAFSGTAPYSFLWSTGATTDSLVNMPAGTYSVIATDDNGDMDTSYTVVSQPAAIISSATVVLDPVCDYDISEVEASGSGGTAMTGYIIDTTSANFNPDMSQTGTVVSFPSSYSSSGILDIGFDFVFFGQTYSQFKLNSEGFLTFELGWNTGWTADHAIPSVLGPAAVIAFAWDDLNPTSGGTVHYYVTGSAPNRVLHVNYDNVPYEFMPNTVTVQLKLFEGSNCIEMHTTQVGPPSWNAVQGIENMTEDQAYYVEGRNFQYWDAANDYVRFCPADASGLFYSWSDGSIGTNVFGLPTGTHTVTVSDGNGCFNTHDVTINAPQSALVSALDANDVTCFGFNNGFIDPAITGGVAPVDYTWSHGPTTDTVGSLAPGVYSVSAEDAVGCTIEVNNIVIQQPDVLLASLYNVQNVLCENDENGVASVAVSGGVPPYAPIWSNGTIGYTATDLSAGSHYVQITDSVGCEAYVPVNVLFDHPSPSPELGGPQLSKLGGDIVLNTLPTSYASYLWSTNETSSAITVSQTGVYWVEVTNGFGCVGSDTTYVEVWPTGVNELSALEGVAIYPNPARDQISFNISGDVATLDITIVDGRGAVVATRTLSGGGVQNMDLSDVASGVYSVRMSADNGQTATQRLIISK